MKELKLISIGILMLIVGLCLLIHININSKNEEIKFELQKALEEAYFKGQKSALEGDIRIKRTKDNCYVWTKSCWDSEKKPIFNPCIETN